MIIRKANLKDAEWILNIRNNESIRKLSIKDQNEIPLEKHILWFNKKLENKKDLFLVIEENNNIEWYCRLDYLEEKKYLISIAINPNTLWKWLWSKLLNEIIKILNTWDMIIAEILEWNSISQNFFKKFWFVEKQKWIYELIINHAEILN